MINDPKITSNSIMEMLQAVQADKEAKKVFLAMPREEQLLAILGMISFINAQFVNLQKDQIEYRREREKKEERQSDILIDTGEKIAIGIKKVMGERFDSWTYFRDRILPPILVAFILGLLYLVFGGKIP